MATVPTLTIRGNDMTDYVQHKTLYWKAKSLDFTLVDPADYPALHDVVSLDMPDWHGRVSTIESHPFKSASGTEHHYVMVTCTNKLTPPDDTAPFGLSDTPNLSTTFPYKDLVVIQTLADQTDLASAEQRLTATVYEPGLLPGMTVAVTNAIEGLSADPYIITEMQVVWLRSDAPEYHIEASVQGLPPPDLGEIIGAQGCDCGVFEPCTSDFTVQSFANEGSIACVFSAHANGQSCASTDYMILYDTARYRLDYYVYHAPGPDPVGSNGLTATLGDYGGGAIGMPASPVVGASSGDANPAIGMGNIRGPLSCTFDPANDIPFASTEYVIPVHGGGPGYHSYDVRLIEASCLSGDSYASSVEVVATWLSGPDPRFEDLDPCSDHVPHSGQRLPTEHFAGDGSNDTFTLDWPYMDGSIEVFVEGVDWTDLVTETDPAAKEFALKYPAPLATDTFPNVEVHYRYP